MEKLSVFRADDALPQSREEWAEAYAAARVDAIAAGAGDVRVRQSAFDSLWRRGLESSAVRTSVTDPYRQVGVIYSVVSTIARHAASVQWGIYRGDERLPDGGDRGHPLYPLLRRPNDQLLGAQVFEATYAYRELRGRAFWILDEFARPRAAASSIPRKISVPDPDWLTPNAPRGELVNWRYQGPEGAATLSKDQVIRFAYFDPKDPYGGVGPLEAARSGYNLAWKSQQAQALFYRNGALPPFYIKASPERSLSPDQAKFLKQQFKDEFLGLENWGTPPITILGTELVPLGISQRDAEWVETQRLTTTQICAIFGVPPFIVGFADEAHMTNSIMFTRNYWGGKVRGLGDDHATVINASLVERFFPGDAFRYDWRSKFAEVMPEETRAAVESAVKMWGTGVPASQAYAFHGIALDTDGQPHLDVGYLPFSVTPADLTLEPQDTAPPADEGKSARPRSARSEAQRAKRWAGYVKRLEILERRYIGDWRKVLAWLRDETIANINSSRSLSPTGLRGIDALLRDDDPGVLLPSRPVMHEQAKKATDAVRKQSVKSGWESLYGDLGQGVEIDFSNPRVAQILARREQAIKGAMDTQAERLRVSLGDGINSGESVDQLADRVRTQIAEAYGGQARAVARTESGSGFGQARYEAAQDAGVPGREWLTARDGDRVRPSHQAVDGEVRASGVRYSNGLMYPHEPGAPAEEVINCRCVELPVAEV